MKRTLIALFITLLLMGCQQAAPAGTFVGEIAELQSGIGIAAEDGLLMAYVCDGIAISEWFRGEMDGSEFDLTNANGVRLQGSIEDNAASGTLTAANGDTYPFTTEVATGDAGLYRAEENIEGIAVTGGWILLNDGRQVGALGGLGGGLNGGLGQFGGQIGGQFGGQIGQIGGSQFGGQFGGQIGQIGGLTGTGGFDGQIGGTGQIGGQISGAAQSDPNTDQTTGTADTTADAGASGTTETTTTTDGSATTTETTGTTDGSATAGTSDSGTTSGGTGDDGEASGEPVPFIFTAPPFDPNAGTVDTPIGTFTPRPAFSFLRSSAGRTGS